MHCCTARFECNQWSFSLCRKRVSRSLASSHLYTTTWQKTMQDTTFCQNVKDWSLGRISTHRLMQ